VLIVLIAVRRLFAALGRALRSVLIIADSLLR